MAAIAALPPARDCGFTLWVNHWRSGVGILLADVGTVGGEDSENPYAADSSVMKSVRAVTSVQHARKDNCLAAPIFARLAKEIAAAHWDRVAIS